MCDLEGAMHLVLPIVTCVPDGKTTCCWPFKLSFPANNRSDRAEHSDNERITTSRLSLSECSALSSRLSNGNRSVKGQQHMVPPGTQVTIANTSCSAPSSSAMHTSFHILQNKAPPRQNWAPAASREFFTQNFNTPQFGIKGTARGAFACAARPAKACLAYINVRSCTSLLPPIPACFPAAHTVAPVSIETTQQFSAFLRAVKTRYTKQYATKSTTHKKTKQKKNNGVSHWETKRSQPTHHLWLREYRLGSTPAW